MLGNGQVNWHPTNKIRFPQSHKWKQVCTCDSEVLTRDVDIGFI